jgi:long-chain fatty acid transport protein
MAQDAVVPSSYASYQVNESVWLGVSVNTPYGLTTRNPYNWAGQAGGRTSAVRSINVTPTLAYRFNDQLSVAAGVQLMQFRVRLTSASAGAGTFAANAASGELDGHDLAYGFTLGATYKPFAGTEVGIGYRSQMKPKLKGFYTTGGVAAGALSDGIGAGTYDVRSDVVLPDQITLGLRQTLTNEFTLLAGFEWTHWEKFSRFPIYTTSGVKANTLVFDYRNAWYASLGGEYKLNKAWTVRAGLGLEHAPINDENRTVRLPDSNRTWTTIGATYELDERMSFDVSYAHLFAKNGTITTPAAGVGTFYADTKGRVDIFAVGVNFKLGAEPKKTNKAMITK